MSNDTDSGIDSDGDGGDISDTETGDDTTDGNTNPTIDTSTKPVYQNLECEPLDETWMCSSGPKNHSLCIKFCTVGLDLSHVRSMDHSLCHRLYGKSSTVYRFLFPRENPKKMVHRNKRNVCASKKNALGLKKVKLVRSWILYRCQMPTIRMIFQI